MLLFCLSSYMGLSWLVTRAEQLCSPEFKASLETKALLLQEVAEVLEQIMGKRSFVLEVWRQIYQCPYPREERHHPEKILDHRDFLWKEFSRFVAGGKAVGQFAEVQVVLESTGKGAEDNPIPYKTQGTWLGDRVVYCKWLAKQISYCVREDGAHLPIRRLFWSCFRWGRLWGMDAFPSFRISSYSILLQSC